MGDDRSRALAAELRRRLGPAPLPEAPPGPSVSLVVVNRDGEPLLRRLLRGLARHTDYPDLELVLVDNGSSDGSLELVRRSVGALSISTVANQGNESFADACNQGAALAGGDLLLFLNNDVEPFEDGWLRELVACASRPGVGIAGATLLERAGPSGVAHGFRVQQRGMGVRDRDGVLRAAPRDGGADPLGEGFGADVETVAVSGACCLVRRDLFRDVGGFTHGYLYGGEDFDLALKVRATASGVVCGGRSFLIHDSGSTLASVPTEERHRWMAENRRLFQRLWGARPRRELELDQLAGRGVWSLPGERPRRELTRARAEAIGFCLVGGDRGQAALAAAVAAELDRRDHRCLNLVGRDHDPAASLTYDAVVHLPGARPGSVNDRQFNVLWDGDGDGPRQADEHGGFDLVFDPGDAREAGPLAERLAAATIERMAATGFPTRIAGA